MTYSKSPATGSYDTPPPKENKVLQPKEVGVVSFDWGKLVVPTTTKPDGGVAAYYDLPPDAVTLNDLIEHKAYTQWLGDTAHLFNIFKAAWRWGIKEGTTKEYDSRKFIYSGARLLMKHAGVKALRDTLQKMLDDPQFQLREKDK